MLPHDKVGIHRLHEPLAVIQHFPDLFKAQKSIHNAGWMRNIVSYVPMNIELRCDWGRRADMSEEEFW